MSKKPKRKLTDRERAFSYASKILYTVKNGYWIVKPQTYSLPEIMGHILAAYLAGLRAGRREKP